MQYAVRNLHLLLFSLCEHHSFLSNYKLLYNVCQYVTLQFNASDVPANEQLQPTLDYEAVEEHIISCKSLMSVKE
jgi:hypothetical protein